MASFVDNKDLEWEIPTLDAFSIMRVREHCEPKFLLNDNEEDNTADRLRNDPVLLCRVIYVLCEKQRRAREVSDEDFYMQVIGGAIDRATAALIEAIDFFIPERTKALFAVVNAQEALRRVTIERAREKVTDPALIASLEQKIDAALSQVLTQPLSV